MKKIANLSSDGPVLIISPLENFRNWGGGDIKPTESESDYEKYYHNPRFEIKPFKPLIDGDTLFAKEINALFLNTSVPGVFDILSSETMSEIAILNNDLDENVLKDLIADNYDIKEERATLDIKDDVLCIASSIPSAEQFKENNFAEKLFENSIREVLKSKNFLDLEVYSDSGVFLKIRPGKYKLYFCKNETGLWYTLKLI